MILLNSNYIDSGSKIYAKQIHVYSGTVYAEIIYQDKDTERDYLTGLWYCSLHKTFGSAWSQSVREKDLIAAHKWADQQLELINKYGTKKHSMAKVLEETK